MTVAPHVLSTAARITGLFGYAWVLVATDDISIIGSLGLEHRLHLR